MFDFVDGRAPKLTYPRPSRPSKAKHAVICRAEHGRNRLGGFRKNLLSVQPRRVSLKQPTFAHRSVQRSTLLANIDCAQSTNMSIWDTLTGRKTSKAPSTSTETLPSESSTSFPSAAFDPNTAQDASSFLTSTSLPDAAHLHPLAGLNQQTLDYLTLDDSALSDLPGSQSALPSRGWSDDLCYGTGTTYLTALILGGSWGLIEGLNRVPGSAPPKLRLNSILNGMTRRGPFLGNTAGVVAMVYNGVNSTIGYYRGKHDAANSIAAGALSGMLFKSTRGVRPMMISGGVVASVAGSWAVRTTSRTRTSLY